MERENYCIVWADQGSARIHAAVASKRLVDGAVTHTDLFICKPLALALAVYGEGLGSMWAIPADLLSEVAQLLSPPRGTLTIWISLDPVSYPSGEIRSWSGNKKDTDYLNFFLTEFPGRVCVSSLQSDVIQRAFDQLGEDDMSWIFEVPIPLSIESLGKLKRSPAATFGGLGIIQVPQAAVQAYEYSGAKPFQSPNTWPPFNAGKVTPRLSQYYATAITTAGRLLMDEAEERRNDYD